MLLMKILYTYVFEATNFQKNSFANFGFRAFYVVYCCMAHAF